MPALIPTINDVVDAEASKVVENAAKKTPKALIKPPSRNELTKNPAKDQCAKCTLMETN